MDSRRRPGDRTGAANATHTERLVSADPEHTTSASATPTADLTAYLDACFPNGATGTLFRATHVPGRKDNGSHAEHPAKWPGISKAIVATLIKESAKYDVYVCPYLMSGRSRAQGKATQHDVIHTDVDNDWLDIETVKRVGGFAIASGTPGHAHVYVPLSRSVSVARHKTLCRALCKMFHGDPAKHNDNDLLRPPGTLNHKPTLDGGDPVPVTWLVPFNGKRVDPDTLAELLDVSADDPTPNVNGHPRTDTGVDQIHLDDYPGVAAAIDHVSDPPDRSNDTMRIVAACVDAGLTLAQARWAVNQREDIRERLDPRKDDDVLRCWNKIESDRQVSFGDPGGEFPPATDSDDIDWAGHSGQLGMAYRLATYQRGKLMHVYGIGWHFWDGKRWAYDDQGKAKRAVYAMLKQLWAKTFGNSDKAKELRQQIVKCESAAGVNGILTLAEVLSEFAATVREIDTDPYLVNCANGTLDLRTMQLHDHDPADRITKVTRAAYDPASWAGTGWETFLHTVLPDAKNRGYLARVIGVAMLGLVIEHNLVILTGTGANGKGTFYKAVCFALGDYADMANPELFMEHKASVGSASSGEMALRGLRLAVVAESGRNRALDEARMKRLTGGDIIAAREVYQKQVTFEASHSCLFVTNHLPKVSGDDKAVWRRLCVVPFDVVIPESQDDKHLGEKLQAEADAILAWAVAGWADYRKRGDKLDEPDSVLVRTAEYRKDSDDVDRFITDEGWVIQAPTVRTTTAKLHSAYERWARREGGEDMTLKAFGQALDDKGFPVTQRTKQGRWRDGICAHPTPPEGDG